MSVSLSLLRWPSLGMLVVAGAVKEIRPGMSANVVIFPGK
jgi:hypothetical protein